MSNDECRYCLCRSNLEKCLATPCNHHDSWYAKAALAEQRERCAKIAAPYSEEAAYQIRALEDE